MALFKNMSITNAGMALYAKAQAGQEIHFTKIQVGSGQIGTQNPATLIALVNPKLDVAITSIIADAQLKSATIIGQVTNINIIEATYICEMGLWANDPDAGEILYGYTSCGTYGDYYAPATQGPYSWQYEIAAAIGNAANVTAQLSQLQWDYGVMNSVTDFIILSGGNQKEINKNIDARLSDIMYQVAGGSVTALTLTIKGTLVTGYPITFIAASNNGGAATTINGKKLFKPATTIAPNLIAGKAYTVWYNSTGDSGNGCFFIKASAEGTALASQIPVGTTFSNDSDTGIAGTAPTIATATITPGISDIVLAAGSHLNGAQTIKGSTSLISANIKAGSSIFGVAGATNVVDTTISSSAATATMIQSGYKCYINGTLTTGTAPTKAAATITPTTTDQTIASGVITTGVQTIKGDANLLAANIKSGISIFGIAGTYDPVTLIAGTSYLLYGSDTAISNTTTTNTLMKSSICNYVGGTVTVSFNLENYNATYSATAQIYVNGSARGTVRYLSGGIVGGVTYTENISVNAGDVVQIYSYSSGAGFYCRISNFRIYSGNSVSVFR
jgi:hypothetical protein